MNDSVDIVIPAYNEGSERVAVTVDACLYQTYPIKNIFVVDDGSTPPLALPSRILSNETVKLLRTPDNNGQAAARNVGLSNSRAKYLASVDVEVVLAPDWLESCLAYLKDNPHVGACCTRIKNYNGLSLLTRWRMRFLEQRYEHRAGSGEVETCTGHAILFRRAGLEEVGGYNEKYIGVFDDADICLRLKDKGYTSHVVEGTHATYLQDDTLPLLARKTLRNSGWALKPKYTINPTLRPIRITSLAANQTYWLLHRMGRNLFKLRLSFLPIDLAVWAYALRIGWEASKNFKQLEPVKE